MFLRQEAQMEYFETQLPDGQLISIERRRNLGFAPWLQEVIREFLTPCIVVALFIFTPFRPPITFAELCFLGPILLLTTLISSLVQRELLDWMRNHAVEPDTFTVIGMDRTTDAMRALAYEIFNTKTLQDTVH